MDHALHLLQERDAWRRRKRVELYHEARRHLKGALAQLIAGHTVILFGSITRCGVFNERSDIDIAIEHELPEMSEFRLACELMERMHRPVDVVLLNESRLRDKILREGEAWIA